MLPWDTKGLSCFLQVFGDYYHFKHRGVVKRSLSVHRGTHVKLQKDPQVQPEMRQTDAPH